MTSLRAIIATAAFCCAGTAFGQTGAPAGAAKAVVAAAVVRVDYDRPLPISRVDLPPADLGFAGAELGTGDNNTTGAFMGQSFTLETVEAKPGEAAAAVRDLVAKGVDYIVALADAPELLAMSDAAGKGAILFNAQAPDDALRNADCRANVFHVALSRSMGTDAVAQFLAWKRWPKWFLVEGSHPGDRALGEAYAHSAKKFGGKIVETRVFEDTGGSRQTDTGLAQVQAQIPVFTQSAPDHDVLVAADENEVFAAYLPYHTWDPRPVVGSAGLTPTTWSPAADAWGGAQLQTRFEKRAGRPMRPLDYNAWLAIRTLGEAATRAPDTGLAAMAAYIGSPDLQLAAFKGQPVNYRPWDHQLRQPVLLASDHLVVSVSPQDGFLHQVTPLDTLGTDAPETKCSFK
ncbi:ABC transporter substrate-binding protein [Amaricoccus solimangrovi]|uniref:Branched-chain amino acid ABC transporter substrate-binding protein n=1 Tax=Amaricoccus solimangrovi TaxID=2589815 RepID=A0A501WV01_9RHOB|nr:ABC transporter substrate-binding protein [Amaricoccus solimangrovi]TPE52135.1 branched-chain amino acid ABC transporter substrate-binding protein [Amaricoccus solimangrovi]